MAWDTNGSNQYAQFAMSAALKAAAGGPFTFGAVVNLDSTADGALIHMMDGTSGRHFLEIFGTYNWGTSAAAKAGPAGSTGSWVHIIMSKATGNVVPEYTIIPLSTGTPSSGTCTGGNLGNGAAPGASGVIQILRFGTSASEWVDAKVAGLWVHASYMDQTAREALLTWALTVTAASVSTLGWAVRLDTLSTINDATPGGGNETARFGTSPFTLVADPTGDANDFFGGGGTATDVPDASPGGHRLRSAYETVSTGVAVADSPQGVRWRSPEGSGVQFGVAATDSPSGLRFRSGYETVSTGVAISDAVNGLRWRSGYEALTLGVAVGDVPSGWRFRSGSDGVTIGGGAVAIPDLSPDGFRLRSVGGEAVLGHLIGDSPNGMRFRAGTSGVTIASGISDAPTGFRWRSAYEEIIGDIPMDAPEATIIAEVFTEHVTVTVPRVRLTATVETIDITAAVRRFRA